MKNPGNRGDVGCSFRFSVDVFELDADTLFLRQPRALGALMCSNWALIKHPARRFLLKAEGGGLGTLMKVMSPVGGAIPFGTRVCVFLTGSVPARRQSLRLPP